MKRAVRRSGSFPTIVVALVAVVSGCATTGALPNDTGDLHRIKKIVDPAASRDSAASRTEFVRVIRREAFEVVDSLPGARRMPLEWRDSLLLTTLWRTRLRVTPAGPEDWDWVVLAPELMTARGDTVFGPRAGDEGGLFTIRREATGTIVDLHRGAVVLREWGVNTDEAICVQVAGACASTTDASFTVRADSMGTATLFVDAGRVTITKDQDPECRAAVARPDVACEGARASIVAPPGTAWSWGPTTSVIPLPVDADTEARLRDAVLYNGKTLWEEGRFPWYPFLIIPAAVVVCVTTDIWFCGSDDASGTVIVRP